MKPKKLLAFIIAMVITISIVPTFTLTVSATTDSNENYTVTFHANDGSNRTSQITNIAHGSQVNLGNNPWNDGKCVCTSWNTQPDGGGTSYDAPSHNVTVTDNMELYAQGWQLRLNDESESFTCDDYSWTVIDASNYEFTVNDDFVLHADIILPAKSSSDKTVIIVNGNFVVDGSIKFELGQGSYGGNYDGELTIKGDGSLKANAIEWTGSNGDTLTVETDVTLLSDYLFLGGSGGQDGYIIIKDANLTTHGLTILQYLTMEGKAKLNITDNYASFNLNAALTLSDDAEIYIAGDGYNPTLYKESGLGNSTFDKLLTDGWLDSKYSFCEENGRYNLYNENNEPETGAVTIKKNYITVTFVDWNGTELQSGKVKKGEAAQAPSDPHRDGYTFTGWDKKFDKITEELTVKAVYTQNEYTVTFVDWNGTELQSGTIKWGEAAQAPNAPHRDGYTFIGWNKKFDKITEELTVKAVYTKNNDSGSNGGGSGFVTRYTVKFNTDGGSTITSQTVIKNNKVTEPTTPTKDGFVFDGWYTDSEFITEYDFDTKVTKSFTLYAKWAEEPKEPEEDKKDDDDDKKPSGGDGHYCPSLEFDDLDITQWYHYDTDFVIEKGIFVGVAEKMFAPNRNMTRAMMITVIYRIEGQPEVDVTYTFGDVEKDAYYASAVAWGQKNGIIKGYSDAVFAPDDDILREQIAAIMHRYAVYKGIDVSVGEETNILSYDDYDEISEYAIPAMQWAVGIEMIKGRTESMLAPKEFAKRVEIAAMLHRFIDTNM